MKTLMSLDAAHMRRVWGSVWAKKCGICYAFLIYRKKKPTAPRSAHSHVMAPELRDPAKAKFVAKRLTLKAAKPPAPAGYYASVFRLAARIEDGPRFEAVEHCFRAQDSKTFLELLNAAWARIERAAKGTRIKKISITLYGLTAGDGWKPSCSTNCRAIMRRRARRPRKCRMRSIKINHRFGRDSVLVGMLPSQGRSFSGTKIAFTRIPDVEEFLE